MFLKTCLMCALFLPVLLASQPAIAESPPILELNAGLNDAWFNPSTDGQGFFIIVFPEIKQVFLAWFTYDTERPAEDVVALLGEPGHRWLTAQGPYDGNTANLTIFVTEGGVFDAAEPAASTDLAGDGTMTLEFADCSEGLVNYEITSLGISGEIPIQRIVPDKIALCEALAASTLETCTRPEPDLSHGLDNPPIVNDATIPVSEVFDGGPGPDGIPPLEFPQFAQNSSSINLINRSSSVYREDARRTMTPPHSNSHFSFMISPISSRTSFKSMRMTPFRATSRSTKNTRANPKAVFIAS